jgi:hypothetical protein
VYLDKGKQYQIGSGQWVTLREHSHVWLNNNGRVMKGSPINWETFQTPGGQWLTVYTGFPAGEPPYVTFNESGKVVRCILGADLTVKTREGKFVKYSKFETLEFDSEGYVSNR